MQYIYGIWDGKLERYPVITTYDTLIGTVTARERDGSQFHATVGQGLYFETPEEAVAADLQQIKEALPGAMEEYQDALTSYRELRRIARLSPEEYMAQVPKDF